MCVRRWYELWKNVQQHEGCWASCGREEGEEERWIGVFNRVDRGSLVQKMEIGQKLEVNEWTTWISGREVSWAEGTGHQLFCSSSFLGQLQHLAFPSWCWLSLKNKQTKECLFQEDQLRLVTRDKTESKYLTKPIAFHHIRWLLSSYANQAKKNQWGTARQRSKDSLPMLANLETSFLLARIALTHSN